MSYELIDSMLEKMRNGELSSPISDHLKMRLTSFERGKASYELDVTDAVTNAMGVLQGGIASTLADAAMAAASMTVLTDDDLASEAITTAQLNSSFLKSVSAGTTLTAHAEVIRTGRQLVWMVCDVRDGDKQVGKFDAVGIRVPFSSDQVKTAGGDS